MAGRRSRWVSPVLSAAIAAAVVGFGTYAFGPARAAASHEERAVTVTGPTGEDDASRTTPVPSASRPAPKRSTCPQGTRQRAVEVALARIHRYGAVIVDGRQSAADCTAI